MDFRLPTLKLSMFTSPDKPHQTQPFLRAKAGECKALVHLFAQLAVEFHEGDEVDLMDAAPRFPSEQEACQAAFLMTSFLGHYKWLQLHRSNDFTWHTVIKFHMAKHLALAFRFGNPRHAWCFG